MEFYIHQDGYVVMKNVLGNILYQDVIGNFNLDSGLTVSLPENMVALKYTDNVTVYYDAKQNAYPVEGSYCPDVVTSVLSTVDTICAAKATREHDVAVAKAAKEATKETEEYALWLQIKAAKLNG